MASDIQPATSPSPGGASPAQPLAVKDPPVFRDKVTGEIIPWTKIHENMAAIDKLQQQLAQGRQIFKQAMKETHGDFAEASRRSNELSGGSCSELWDNMHDQKVVCSLVVVCPPAKDKNVMLENEERVKMMIGQISGYMHRCIVEVWTSRKEIGSVSETFVSVRFPYHMWAKVEELGASISQVNVGTHHFNAYLSLDARKKLVRHGRQVEQWELQINGHSLPELKKESLAEMQEAAKASFAEKLDSELQVDQIEKTGLSPEVQDMLEFLWDDEIIHVKKTETWRILCMLNLGNDVKYMSGMFQFGGIVINAADQASDPRVKSSVMCCEVNRDIKFPGSPLFHDLTLGDQFVTLDAPFVLKMSENSIIKQDREGGVAVIFCWRYHLGGEQGVTLENAGLCFMQHLTYNRHLCNLLTLAQILKPQMNQFSTKIACMQAAQSSSSSVSEVQVASIE